MIQENKNLLIKDLCARLPYGVKVQYEDGIFTIDHISAMYEEVKLNTHNNYTIDVLEVKPYLFPLSSMTEEQEIIYGDLCYAIIRSLAQNVQAGLNELNDWLNRNNFDYRGLIPLGLANDATGKNIY